jgi:hypothetical protein
MPTHFPQAVPEIPVRIVEEAAQYYVSVLGFSFDWGDDDGWIGRHPSPRNRPGFERERYRLR